MPRRAVTGSPSAGPPRAGLETMESPAMRKEVAEILRLEYKEFFAKITEV